MSGISSVTNTPAFTPQVQNAGPSAPANTAQAPASPPAAAGDSVRTGGGQAASGDLQMYQAADVVKDTSPPLPPMEQPVQTSAPDIKPYEAPPVREDDVKKPQPIRNTHFSIIEGPASPDP